MAVYIDLADIFAPSPRYRSPLAIKLSWQGLPKPDSRILKSIQPLIIDNGPYSRGVRLITGIIVGKFNPTVAFKVKRIFTTYADVMTLSIDGLIAQQQ